MTHHKGLAESKIDLCTHWCLHYERITRIIQKQLFRGFSENTFTCSCNLTNYKLHVTTTSRIVFYEFCFSIQYFRQDFFKEVASTAASANYLIRDHLRTSLLMLNESKQINYRTSIPPEITRKPYDFRENRCYVNCLNSLNVRSESWRRSINSSKF